MRSLPPARAGGHDIGPEVLGFHDRVDDQLRREAEQVDIGGELGAAFVDEPLALVGVVDRGDLVGVDRVDRRLRAHHRDARRRQRDAGVGPNAGPANA